MIDASNLLKSIPDGLRDPLIKCYQEIGANYVERRWEPAELNGGKFCEVAYTIVQGGLLGTFPTIPSKPARMIDACRALEQVPRDPNRAGDQSLRVLIPRTLPVLYEIRNNRGVGHVGGDVNPNFLDATAVYGMASWILAELVRIFHHVSTKEAQYAVDALIERKHPIIWEVGDVRRVLDPNMEKKDQALLLLHQRPGWVSDSELCKWVEYSTLANFKRLILQPFHDQRLLEYDKKSQRAQISPLGVQKVEREILKSRI
ncbi:hypothetical protein ACSHT2_08655 [Bradyrhizobium sp. PUT101]|uniref:hypothetical protein n=1 Tax=Bradyrhizobium sp. PUT101 TaxID=3447427 RepID=UPI003F8318A1